MESSKILKVKWNKSVFEIDASSMKTIGELKIVVSKQSNVLPGEQKLIYKSKVLKDDNDLSKIPSKATISMLGAASTTSLAPKPNVTFIEDLTPEQKLQILREKGEEVVFGLVNLGNTCYLNSTVQCLGRVPELRKALKELAQSAQTKPDDMAYMLAYSLGVTYNSLDKASDAVSPDLLVAVIRKLNPLFADNDNGHFKQQDADECVSLILNSVKKYLPNKEVGEKYSDNLIEELFGIKMQIQLKNIEVATEVKKKEETVYKLICYIDSNTIELVEGLKKSLKENIDLYSDALARNTVFEKDQYVNRLPPYVTVQFMRFFWKQANELTGAKAGKAKILKSVLFSKTIDLYDMCTDETKEILNLGRKIEAKMFKDDKNFKVENVVKKEGQEMIPTGKYQLISVITHQGRSSESGHYIGWVHKKDDKWLKYDDDTVTMVTTTDILELKGGGDWHMAYICFFKMLEVPFMEVAD